MLGETQRYHVARDDDGVPVAGVFAVVQRRAGRYRRWRAENMGRGFTGFGLNG